MNGIDHLLTLARAYGEAADLPVTTVSWRVFGDTKKLPRIMTGADLQTRRLEKAMRWFSQNWPAGLAWPADVPRPLLDEKRTA